MSSANASIGPPAVRLGKTGFLQSFTSLVVLLGLVLPVIVLIALAVLGPSRLQPDVLIVLISLVPMMTAIFASATVTGVISLIAVLVGVQLTLFAGMPGVDGPEDALPALIALIALSALATCAVLVRDRVGTHKVTRPSAPGGSPSAKRTPGLDELTGLPIGPVAIKALESASAERHSDALVVMLDVDDFRKVNAEFGVEIADECLGAIAGRLRYRLPDEDVVSRWQGDEFLVVIDSAPEGTAEQQALLDRIRGCASGQPIRTAAGLIPLTAAISARRWKVGQSLDEVIDGVLAGMKSAKD